jgi:hypothetical protein
LKYNTTFILYIFTYYFYVGLTSGNYVTFILFEACSITVCETKSEKVIAASTEENVQPFKDKINKLLDSGKLVIL